MRLLPRLALAVLSLARAQRQKAEDARVAAVRRATAAAPIFGEISIAPEGTIALGTPFAQRVSGARAVAPGLFLLVGDGMMSYGGTDSLLVEVGADAQVRAGASHG